jgi:hypothetical protein
MTARWVWFVMIIGIGIEVGLGVACLVLVPVRRPDQWLPAQSKSLYVAPTLFSEGFWGYVRWPSSLRPSAGRGSSASGRRSAWSVSFLALGAGSCP